MSSPAGATPVDRGRRTTAENRDGHRCHGGDAAGHQARRPAEDPDYNRHDRRRPARPRRVLTRLLHFSSGVLSVASGIILLIAIWMVFGHGDPALSSLAVEGKDPLQPAIVPFGVPYLLNPAGIVVLMMAPAESGLVGLFVETTDYFGRLQQKAEIAGVEPFFEEPRGGD